MYHFNIVLSSSLLLIGIGLKDDLIGLSVNKKLLIQITASILFLLNTDFKINNLYGFLGIYELNNFVSLIISIFFMVFLTNSINLIDGINGLAGTVSIFTLTYLSFLFLGIIILSDILCFNSSPKFCLTIFKSSLTKVLQALIKIFQ